MLLNKLLKGAAVAVLLVFCAPADDDTAATNAAPVHPAGGRFMIAPVAGWDHNEYSAFNPYTRSTEIHRDTAGEYGLLLSYVSPRFNVNNILFYTNPNDSKVWGDILSASVSGDPKARVTWAVGGSYTWHMVEIPGINIHVNEPLVRAGPLVRIPEWHMSVNPYVGYAHLAVHTTYGYDAWDTGVYGILGRWDWRMLHFMAQYYLQDNPAERQVYQVFRARLMTFFTEEWGFMARVEHMRQFTSKDTSLLLGPVYLF
jgi:hypothetical protein